MAAPMPGRRDGRVSRVGLISDTHGLLRPQALELLGGSDFIVHAGDVGNAAILEALRAVAPLTAVRGNNDHGPWAEALPHEATLEVGGVTVHVVHEIAHLHVDPGAAGIDVVVTGHSHRPSCERRGEVLYVNPGSAGPRRFKLPLSVARLTVRDGRADAEILPLDA
jgi:putative phosphoesterase